ncbi:MAG: hypothetical protein WAV98_00285, partial [Minisyncoccia bacterium]
MILTSRLNYNPAQVFVPYYIFLILTSLKYFELRNSISVIASRYSDVAIYVFILDCHALRARKDRIISSFV